MRRNNIRAVQFVNNQVQIEELIEQQSRRQHTFSELAVKPIQNPYEIVLNEAKSSSTGK